ncbi:hypothetical protein X777_04580 [Ooceraea biroi]|uniref:Uncharacterized protein n=1 Tax=Ooceraea biroi TaxID=2015173 RepID=A0A026X4B4_OOCBI|nr:hypothetical protein X777_04580 [Ooceraea biroi]
MTRDRRLLLLLGLLMAYGMLAAECRHRQREDAAVATTTTRTTEARHRHRHRHESSNRNHHHDRRSWQNVDEYEYDGDSEDPIDEDDSYETRLYYDRPRLSSRHQAAQRSYHDRMFEPRYPPRYYGGGYHTGNGWYDEDDGRRRIPSRYNTRYHRYRGSRTHRRPAYPRDREVSDLNDDSEEDFDYDRPHRYIENDEADKWREWWRNTRRRASFRRDWRNKMNAGYRGARRHRLGDRDEMPRWMDDWRRKGGSNSSESQRRFSKDEPAKKSEEDEDYEDHGGLEEGDKDEDEDEIWKDIDDEENEEKEKEEEEEEEEELDNDFYKSETKPPLKTYEDIIRRLTSDDPTTPRTTIKRDYRNTETSRHIKRDGYRNPKFLEPRNVSRPVDPFATTSNYFAPSRRTVESSAVKSAGHKPPKNAIGATVKNNDRQEGKIVAKINDTQAKTKSLEQDYDEYLNAPDNEKEEDLAKAGVDDDSGMQADVTNTKNPLNCSVVCSMPSEEPGVVKSVTIELSSRYRPCRD